MKSISFANKIVGVAVLVFFTLSFSQLIVAQDVGANKLSALDQLIKSGFELISQKKYNDATMRFQEAINILDKDPLPSEWLFTKFTLPDENPNDPPRSETARRLGAWRHSMGTKQALLTFLAFSSQLEGRSEQAKKYFNAIYELQSPIWGLSWRVFIPPTQALFYTSVPKEKSENYGRYLMLAGRLLYSVESEQGIKLLREGQVLLPNDAEAAADLTGYLLISFDFAGAKKFAELSLSIKPDQKRVLIDLTTANWMLGDVDAAAKNAGAAQKLPPDLPGPHASLALIAIEKGDFETALKKSDISVKLSERFPYYLTVRAIALEASGKSKEAEILMKEAWKDERPDSDRLERWFFRGKSLDLALKVVGRLK